MSVGMETIEDVRVMQAAAARKKTAAPEPHTALWGAFIAAQAEFGPIIKSNTGARPSQKYAPLDVVLDAVRPVLNKHGLALTQATFVVGDALYVRTAVVHIATGYQHCAEYPAGPLALQHQQLGAGVTYARRYSLLSLLGVCPENEDDDGEKAGAAGGERAPAQTPPRQQQSSAAAKRDDVWGRFERTLASFRDVDELERWWSDADTQAKVDQMPAAWRAQAYEAYEKRQEALLRAGAP